LSLKHRQQIFDVTASGAAEDLGDTPAKVAFSPCRGLHVDKAQSPSLTAKKQPPSAHPVTCVCACVHVGGVCALAKGIREKGYIAVPAE